MLEGAVARLLNQLLGKYVVDLDTENLNVGIFSGHVQLTDLKLKTEALYELNLPVQVIAGTISKIRLQIPWTSLWSQPVIVNVEDVHIIAGPIVSYGNQFDEEKNKRLLRAFKRQAIQCLNDEYELIGGPVQFREYLISSIVNNLQLNITNVHIRYEDRYSTDFPLAAGICIGSITAETTNNKWKPTKQTKHDRTSFYLIKMEAFSVYWNSKYEPIDWDLPSQYYNWRNAMSNSLKNYALNDQNFEFILKPMTVKIKTTIQKSNANNNAQNDSNKSEDDCRIAKITSDVVVQDCNLQITKLQYESIVAAHDALQRMYTAWNYLPMRPQRPILRPTPDGLRNSTNSPETMPSIADRATVRAWWKYAYLGCLEQRIRPYYWTRIRNVRENYKNYCEIYKKILLNPKDTELKLDLQQYEDKLSVVNIVIARQHTRLLVHCTSLSEKSFWDILPSPERTLLCDKIGYGESERVKTIEHCYNLRVGNVSLTLHDSGAEIFILTLTQLIAAFQPNLSDKSFALNTKIEALIVDGISSTGDESLVTLISSQHLHNSPAYFLKFNLERTTSEKNCNYRLNGVLESLEIVYNEVSVKAFKDFVGNCNQFAFDKLVAVFKKLPYRLFASFKDKIRDKWDVNFDVRMPHLVLPENGTLQMPSNNLMVIDCGHVIINTELVQETDISENATQMELEEQLYSRLYLKCDNAQLLFCDRADNWKDARKEKDTDLHLISKFDYTAIYGTCVKTTKTLPKEKFNMNISSVKCNLSERKIGKLLKYLNSINSLTLFVLEESPIDRVYSKDTICNKLSPNYLHHVQNALNATSTFVNKSRRSKQERSGSVLVYDKRKMSENNSQRENANEVWARTVDLPGLEDNVSPNNNFNVLLRFVVGEFQFVFSRSNDKNDRDYLMLRLGSFSTDVGLMSYGPAFQLNVNSILLTDKLHTTPSGQYLDLIHSPVPSTTDVVTVLYRKVAANCPDFWTHFHGVETSLVADFGTLNVMLHQEAVHTIVKYTRYINEKIKKQMSEKLLLIARLTYGCFCNLLKSSGKKLDVPVPPGSVKFSHSARLSDLNVRICDSDFDFVNVRLSGLEMDFLFKANERFVFRSFLSNLNVDHLSDVTLYPKVFSTDEDKVFEVKYVRYANTLHNPDEITSGMDETVTGGSFKFHLGQIHVVFLYKLIVQLHRFVMNLDISDLIDDIIDYMWRRVARGMETFKSNTKIHLAINIKGPVVLFPQKSSSPNLLVFDIGGLNVENFFKEYPNEYVENILLKLDGITITRGIMTLTSTLVMQEVIIEPLGCHIDVKRYVPLMQTKQSQTPAPGYATIKRPNWDIDGVMDTVQVTLGQKDLTTLLSIYTDNIGEGKLLDLFPTCNDSVTPSVAENDDETVKTLEAFFCEPKQKDVTVKFSFDGLSLLLFFDSGEMLSSPIRDLNHGLCKLDVVDVVLSFVVYTDTSLDGKLSMDMIQIEEIGPDANAYDKNILQSPMDDNKNNNCHITVNKPPIIDVTFHKNKTNDKSIDIIVGRLNLSLSVPFCEKLAMFVLECVPKDIAGEAGIINQGYVGDGLQEHERTVTNSLTVALRVNRPEFTFVVETTSNKKRYFITKTEILVDYSRHIKMLNFVVSLSGLHSLFYDYSPEPYTILKQCDVEVSKSFNEEKGTKITAVVSSVYVQICNRIVYNLNDILNDIIEHFKVPELEDGSRKNSVNQQDIFVLESQRNEFSKQKRDVVGTVRKNSRNSLEYNDLWSPCKIINYETFDERTVLETQSQEHENTGNLQVLHEIFLLQKTEIVVVMELEDVSVLLLKATLEATMYDWSSFLNCTCELTLQANYFNENLQQWEPFIDPIVVDHDEYKPWEMTVKVFQDKCIPMLSNEARTKKETKRGRKHLNTFKSNGADTVNDADVDDDDDDDEASEDDMVYLEPSNAFLTRNTRIKTSLSTFLDDTDSENEDGTMEKLAAAISDLFTGDWNESVCSESDYSSDGDDDSGDETVTIKRRHQEDALEETPSNYKKSIYILIDSKEVLNITITPSLLKVLNELFTIYSNKTLSIINSNLPAMNLINDIGPKTRVELYEKKSHESTETGQNNNEGNGADDAILLCSKTYEKQDSCTNSPTKSNYYSYDYNGGDADDKDSYTDDISKIDIEMGYDDETMSSLAFPTVTTPYLYEKINKNHLKIHVPGFQTIQTSCPKRWWQKLIKLHPIINNQLYYVIAKHTIGKRGRSVTVTSPLQISNETCFALSVLYQPSALQQLNLEPVGDVTNPFETTMRIAVLEPHEKYNVPLFIAYHSKLFIQPAYAEGHYASDNGIWWKDLSTDLDVAHNFHCEPKSKSNLEVFSLRLMLKKNVEVKNSHVHSIPNYVIYLLPPLILHNFLPYSLEVQNVYLKQQMKIEPGEQTSVYSLNLSKDQKLLIKISYANLIWSGILNLTTHLDEKIVNLTSESNKNMSINVKTDRDGSCNIYFYTPYWIINKTTLPLHIKGSSTNVIYESTSEEILLFTYKRHGKQMLNMKVYESDWSNDFGLDCLGTTGLVVCKDNVRKKRYTFLVSIRLSELCPKYTKLIFILPNFIVANNTNRNLRFMEHNEKTDLWIDLNPHSSLPFWPETSSMQMYVKFRDSKLNSQAFFISTMHHTVLRMDRGGALCVDVTGGKNESFFITFNEYRDGDAPVFIKNMCPDLFLKVQQQGQSQVTLLSPFNGLLYTWDDPTKPRQLIWNVYNNKGSGFLIDISKDSYGEEKINFHSVSPNQMSQTTSISSSDDSDTSSVNSESSAKMLNVPANAKKIRKCKIVIYWICYRNGKQKTLMFTQQQRNYNQLVKDIFMEQCDLDCLLSLAGIGVSLFTDQLRRKEYVYVSMAEVPAIWEVNVGHKWKQLTLELASWIEDKYKLNYKKCQLKDYVQIDFEKMFMIKPFFAELKRTYNPAVYAQYRKSHKHRYYNAKLQQLQIDNKNKSSTASAVVLNMLPRLPLDTYKFAIVPLLEINCLRFNWKNCDVYKNVHVNVSDFYINVDSDLIRTVANLFLERFKLNREELGACYRKDMNSIRLPMKNKKPASGIIIENVHLSQFSVQIYVSGRNPNNIRSCSITNFLHYFFPSNLSPYMPAEGLKHKITTLELTDLKAMLRNILIDVLEHVRVQFLQQYYSQVMGLQVLVNPYANQIIPSNEKLPNDGDKMANVTLFACRCLLGHLNMSSAALEQCIMDIFSNQTMENIQRIRRHGSYQKSCGLPKNITSVSKRFNPGVILGLNQIIVNNANSNIQCDGERFFKGIGKALLSLITRHPDEKSDSVQVAIEAIKRAVILGEPITIHQRLTRYYNNYLGLKPFCMYESMGQHLLETVANGRFSTDNYWSHAIVDKQGKLIVIVTLEHTIKINKCRLWGTWELEWCVDLDEIISVPKVISNELIINVRQGEINPNSAAGGKLTVSGDKETLAWLKEKIGQAIIVSMEEKSWIIQ